MTTDSNPKGEHVRRGLLRELLLARAEGLVEGVQILNAHRDEVVTVMTHYGFTDPNRIGGYLDRDLD